MDHGPGRANREGAERPSPADEVPRRRDDGRVVRQVRQGDRDAFATLVRAYQLRLFGLLLMIVRSPAGAEDVTQEAFVRAFRNLHRYDDTRPFYPWLAAIAIRLAHNWLRQHGRTMRREGAAIDQVAPPAEAPVALDALIAGERSRRVWAMVASLPARERAAGDPPLSRRLAGARHCRGARRHRRNHQDHALSCPAPDARDGTLTRRGGCS
jgi:RNA polymerase sigma factor (sigma-70 family)